LLRAEWSKERRRACRYWNRSEIAENRATGIRAGGPVIVTRAAIITGQQDILAIGIFNFDVEVVVGGVRQVQGNLDVMNGSRNAGNGNRRTEGSAVWSGLIPGSI